MSDPFVKAEDTLNQMLKLDEVDKMIIHDVLTGLREDLLGSQEEPTHEDPDGTR